MLVFQPAPPVFFYMLPAWSHHSPAFCRVTLNWHNFFACLNFTKYLPIFKIISCVGLSSALWKNGGSDQWGLYSVHVRQRRDTALFPNYFGQTC